MCFSHQAVRLPPSTSLFLFSSLSVSGGSGQVSFLSLPSLTLLDEGKTQFRTRWEQGGDSLKARLSPWKGASERISGCLFFGERGVVCESCQQRGNERRNWKCAFNIAEALRVAPKWIKLERLMRSLMCDAPLLIKNPSCFKPAGDPSRFTERAKCFPPTCLSFLFE